MILAGMTLLGLAVLSMSGFLDVSLLLESKRVFIFAVALTIVGLLDALASIVLARW